MKTNTNTKKLAVTVTLFIILSFNLAFAETFEKIIVPKHNNGVNINSEDQVVIFAGEKESVVIKNGVVVTNLNQSIPILPENSFEKNGFNYFVNFYHNPSCGKYYITLKLIRVVEKKEGLEISSLNPLDETDFIEVKEIRKVIKPFVKKDAFTNASFVVSLKNFEEVKKIYSKIDYQNGKNLTKKGWEKH